MIEADGLAKDYEGAPALREVSFTVPTGSVFAFIGPNGAGKTTTLKILGALLKPTAGRARVMGIDVAASPDEARRLVGWMPDQYGVYPELKTREYLDFFASAYGVERERRSRVVERTLERVGLAAKRDALVGALSRGMTQKLCLARALLHDPPVLLLDEPASGLDPQARFELRDLIRGLQAEGKTVLVSSHILPELVEYCDGAAVLQGGVVKFAGPLSELGTELSLEVRRVRVRLAPGGSLSRALEILGAVPSVRRASGEGRAVGLELAGDDSDLADVLDALVRAGVRVAAFEETRRDLGELFLELVRKEA
ncbi:MAG: ABC transporter ATP-binding protein [Elusimicrobia bacterium]|nr:ABC transporter ATP-binding protein [Elusimicrobiota bacterium]